MKTEKIKNENIDGHSMYLSKYQSQRAINENHAASNLIGLIYLFQGIFS